MLTESLQSSKGIGNLRSGFSPSMLRSIRSCVKYTFGGSSLAEIHCTQDEPRVGIADWEQLVSPLLVCLGVVRYGIGLVRRQLNRACLIGDGVETRSIWVGVICLLSWEDVKLTQFTCLLRSFCLAIFPLEITFFVC